MDPNPENARLTAGDDESSFLTDLAGSIPGIDEAMSFAEVMRQVTAPSPALTEHGNNAKHLALLWSRSGYSSVGVFCNWVPPHTYPIRLLMSNLSRMAWQDAACGLVLF